MSFSLVESSSAKYLAVHLLIILSRLEEEKDPSHCGGGGPDGKRRRSNQERNSKMAVVGRPVELLQHNALAKEFFSPEWILCKQFFFCSIMGHFHKQENGSGRREITIASFPCPPPSFNSRPSNPWPSGVSIYDIR